MSRAFPQALSAFWSARNSRERTMLATAIAVVVAGLVYALLIDPALSARADLAQRLPQLRQQAAEMRALTRAAQEAAPRTAAPVRPLTRESVEASLARRGLKAQEVTISADILRLRFEQASFAGLTDWLIEMRRDAHTGVVEAKVEAGSEPDRVNAAFTLRQLRGAAS